MKFGTTRQSVDNVATVANAPPVPSALNETTDPRRVPATIERPTMPLDVMITAANTVSRASVSAADHQCHDERDLDHRYCHGEDE